LIVQLEPNNFKPVIEKEVMSFWPITDEKITTYKLWLQSQNWSDILKLDNANSIAEDFLTLTFKGFEDFLPRKEKTIKQLDKAWMTDKIRELISQRNELLETNRLDETKRLWNLVDGRDGRKVDVSSWPQNPRVKNSEVHEKRSQAFSQQCAKTYGSKKNNPEILDESGNKL
jgi:hypothetical protein